jgi:tetratricopeptide (TPR) repeat protein
MNSMGKRKLHIKAVNLHEKAHKFVRKGRIDQALNLYQQALEIALDIDALELKAHALCNMAQLIANKGDFNTAFSFMDQSIEIVKELKAPDLEEVVTIYEDIKFMQTQNEFEYLLNSPELQEEFKRLIKKPNNSMNTDAKKP